MKKSAPTLPTQIEDNSHLVKIGEASEILGVSIDTLRRWEKKGWLRVTKTPGGTRLYSKDQLIKLNPNLNRNAKSLLSPTVKKVFSKPEQTPSKNIFHTGNESRNNAFRGFPEMSISLTTDRSILKKVDSLSAQNIEDQIQDEPKEDFVSDFINPLNSLKQSITRSALVIIVLIFLLLPLSLLTNYIKNNQNVSVFAVKYYNLPLSDASEVLNKLSQIFTPTFSQKFLGFYPTGSPPGNQDLNQIAKGLTNQPRPGSGGVSGDLKGSKFTRIPRPLSGQVLSESSPSGSFLQINLDAEINGNFAVDGEGFFTGPVTAPNLLYGLTAGDNIQITGDAQNPTISSSITEADTLQTVTGRGATTTVASTFSGGLTASSISLTGALNMGQLSSDPSSAVNGATYYNTTSNTFRCYKSGSWQACDTDTTGTSFSGLILGADSGTDEDLDEGDTITIAGSNGITTTVAATDTVTLALDVTTTSTTSTTTANSGLELTSAGLSLLRGCSDDQSLVWDDSIEQWTCGSPQGLVNVKESSTTISTASTLEFLGGDFDLSESPAGTALIQLAANLQSVTGVAGNFDVTGTLVAGTANAFSVSTAGGITIPSTQTLTVGTVGLSAVGSSNSTSGGTLVGLFDEFANSSATNLQDVLDDLDAAIGAGSSKWGQGSGFIYVANTTDDVIIGDSTVANASFHFDESAGIGYFGTNESLNGNLTLYSSGASITDPSLASDASGNLIIDSANFDVTSTGINNTVIGASTAAAATFTTLTATGNVTLNDAGADNILIGAAADTVTITSNSLSLTDDNWSVNTSGAAAFASVDSGSGTIQTTGSVFGNSIDRSSGGALAIGNTNATSVSLCNSASCDTISIGTNSDADSITIGDSNDTFTLASNAFNVSSAGALTGITTITTSGAINTATISGGTLSGGTFSGGSVSGGTLTGTALSGTGNFTITGGTGSGQTLTLISTSHGTKGDIQFFSSANAISSSGDLTIAGSLDAQGITSAGTISFTDLSTNGVVIATGGTGTLATEAQLALSRGGTNKNLTPVAGGIVYTDADSLEVTSSAGTSGQCLKSAAGAEPTWGSCVTAAETPFGTSGGVITKSTAGDYLSLRYGDAADTQLEIQNTTSSTIPTADSMVIDLTGGTTGIVTDGVDALFITAEFGDNSGASTRSGLHLDINPVDSPTSDDTLYGINIDGLASTFSSTDAAINIGDNWDKILETGSIDISGAGAISGATSINSVTITAPASAATLTLANNSTLATSGANSLTLTTTGTTNATFPTGTITLADLESNQTITGLKTVTRSISANSGTTNNQFAITFSTPADSSGTNVHQGLNITPTIGNATAGTNTANFVNIAAVTGDAQVTTNAVNIGAMTGTAATETAVNVGSGWDSALTVGGSNIINGSGVLQSAGLSGTYSNALTLDSTSNAITAGTLTVNSDAFTDLTGNGLAISSNSLVVNLLTPATNGASSTLNSPSGLEFASGMLTMIQGCGDNELLTWDEGNDYWECNTVAGVGAGGDITAVGDVTSGAAFTATAGNDGTQLFFEGSTADSNEIQLTSADPGSDLTVTLPAITGTLASLAGTQTFTGAKSFTGGVTLGTASSNTGTLTFAHASHAFTTTFQASGSQSQTNTFTLPVDDGSSNYVLSTDGNGVLSWQSVSGVGAGTGDITSVGSMTTGDVFADASADDDWLGLGASAGRIEFDDQTIDEVNILSAFVSIGSQTPTSPLFVNNTTYTVTADANAAVVDISGALTEAGSGTHARLVGVSITAPTITAGAGSVTNTASLYIAGAPSSSGATNYALWIDSGNVRFDGTIQAGSGNEVITLSTGKIDADAIGLISATNGASSTTSSASGLEVVSDTLTLLQGCSDTDTIAWDETNDVWACSTPTTAVVTIAEGATQYTNQNEIQFNEYDFGVQDSGATSIITADFTNFGSRATPFNLGDALAGGSNGDSRTIDIGGVDTDITNTINIATNSTSADVLTIGNTNSSSTLALFGGDDWSITTAGLATFAGNVNANGGFDVDDAFVIADGGVLTTSQAANLNAGFDVDDIFQVADGGAVTANTDVNFTFAGAEDFAITSDLATSGTLNVQSIVGTPSSTNGTIRGLLLQQASSSNTNGLDTALLIDNADDGLAITDAISITNSGGGGYTDLIDTPTFDVSGAGAISGATGITSSGTITFSGLSTAGVVLNNASGVLSTTAQLSALRGGTGIDTSGSTGVPSISSGTWSVNALLPLSLGGTNKNLTAIAGGVVYTDADSIEVTSAGTTGQCFVSNGSSAPAWDDCDSSATTPFTVSGGIIDKTTVGDRLRLLYGDAGDTQFTIENTTNGTIPTADAMAINLTGGTTGIETDGADGLFIAAEFGNGTSSTRSGLHIDIDPVNSPTSDDTFYGLNIDGLASGTSAVESAINVGSNWDNILNSGSIDITGTGAITGATGITSSGTITFSGLTTDGVVIVSSGALSSEAQLAVSRGGTGATSVGSAGSIAYSNGSAFAFSGVGTSGQAVLSGGSGSPTFTTGTLSLAGNFAVTASNAITLTTGSGGTTATIPTGTITLADLESTQTFTGAKTFNTTTTLTYAGAENLGITSDLSGTVSVASVIGTPSSSAGTTIGFSLQQADSSNSNGLDTGIYINNLDTDLAVGTAIQIANTGGGGYTTFLDTASIDITGAGAITGATGFNSLTISSGTVTSGVWNGTAIDPAYGGTGLTSYTVGDLLYASGTTTLSKLAGVATGNVLISGGVSTAPSWGKVALTTHVSGVLPVANGGTETSTAPTSGQLLIGNSGGTYSVASPTSGNGISWTLGSGSIQPNLSSLTSDWNQSGAFDIVLDNASSELRIMESSGGTFYGTIDVEDLSQDRSYILPSYAAATPAKFCLDTGNCAGLGGTISGAGNAGQIAYFTTTSNITSDSVFNIDGTNHRLGINTSTPATLVNIFGESEIALFDPATISADSDTNNSPTIRLRGTYDSDPNGTVSSANESFDLRTIAVSGGASPVSRFAVSNVNNAGSSTEILSLLNSGSVGINDSSPDAFLEVLGTTEQLRLTYTDGSADSRFTVDSSGNLTINNTGTTTTISDDLTVSGGDVTGSNSESIDIGEAANGTISFLIDGTSGLNVGSTGISSIGNVAHTIVNSSGALNIDSNSTGAINLGTSANAKTITVGNATGATALAFNSGTGAQTFTSQVVTGTTTTSAFVFDATAITTGTGAYFTTDSITQGKLMQLATTGNTLTTGTILDLRTTATSLTGAAGTGSLLNLDWSPGSATTATGDLISLNIGTNGTTTGSLFNILDSGSSIFSVKETAFETSLPSNFTAPGDVSIAYDIQFTNPTASYIKSYSALTIQPGDPFGSSNLTLSPYNEGSVYIPSNVATAYGVDVDANLLSTGRAMDISSSSTAGGASGNSYLLYLDRTGANSNSTHTAYGIYSTVTNTGTTLTNVGGFFTASSATASSNAYAIQTGAATVASSGTLYSINTGALTGASSGTIASINTGALSGAGTATYGINLGANSATATTNYGINIGALSGAGTTNNGIAIGAVSGATNNYEINFAGTSPEVAMGNGGTLTFSDGTNTLCQIVDGGTTGTLTCTGTGTLASDLQDAYDNSTTPATITLSSTDDSLVFTNPTSSGTDLGYLLHLNQAHTTGAVSALDITQASSGADGVNLTANSIDTENALDISATGLTSGIGVNVALTEATLNGGYYFRAYDNTAAGAVFSVGEDGQTTIAGSAEGTAALTLTAGDAVITDGDLTVSSGETSLTSNSNTVATLSLTNNTATTIGNGANTSGVIDLQSTSLTTGNFMNLEVNALTTGKGINLTNTTTLTTGTLLYAYSASTALAGTTTTGNGLLGNFEWAPGSSTTGTGDLFRIAIGSNGSLSSGSLFNIVDSSSSIFSVKETDFTTSLPTNFTAAGDVGIAYDLVFSNPTASYIKSAAPLAIVAGETFNSSNLTLQTYNQGTIVFDTANTTTTAVDITNTALTTGTALNIALSGSSQTTAKALAITQSGTTTGFTGNFIDFTGSSTTGAGNLLALTTVNTTDGSALNITANSLTTGEALEITSTGTIANGGNLVALTANSATTGDILNISSTGITTGQVIDITGPTSTGVTGNFINIATDVGSAGALMNLAPDFSGSAVTGYGLKLTGTDSTANGNTDYGIHSTLTLTGNAAKTAAGIYSTITDTSTNAGTLFGADLLVDPNGVTGTGNKTIYGIRAQVTNDTPTDTNAATIYGGYFSATGNTGGTGSTSYGVWASASGADTNYPFYTGVAFPTGSGNSAALCWDNSGESAIYDCDQAPIADYMEMYSVKSNVTLGDIVSVSDEYILTKDGERVAKLQKSDSSYQNNIIGIVSDKSKAGDFNSIGYNINEYDNPQPIALNGRVPVKIASSSQAIQKGDYITTSTEAGKGMKANQPGQMVGKALEDWTPGSGKQTVMVYVMNGYADPSNALANLLIGEDGSLLSQNIAAENITVSSDVNVSGLIKASGFHISAGSIQRIGALANLPISANNTVSLADAINSINTDLSDLKLRTTNYELQTASNSAQLSQTNQIAQQAIAQAQSLDEKVASTSANLSSLSDRISDLLASISDDSNPSSPSATSYPSDLDLTPPDVLFASDSATLANLNITDTLSSYQLQATSFKTLDATVSATFKSLGETFLGNTVVAGDFSVDGSLSLTGSSINSLACPPISQTSPISPTDCGVLFIQNSPLASTVDFFNGAITLTKDGILTAKEIVTDQIKVTADKSAGQITIPAGEVEIAVLNELVRDDSIIILTSETPGAPNLAIGAKVAGSGFIVKLNSLHSEDVKFSYLIVGQSEARN